MQKPACVIVSISKLGYQTCAVSPVHAKVLQEAHVNKPCFSSACALMHVQGAAAAALLLSKHWSTCCNALHVEGDESPSLYMQRAAAALPPTDGAQPRGAAPAATLGCRWAQHEHGRRGSRAGCTIRRRAQHCARVCARCGRCACTCMHTTPLMPSLSWGGDEDMLARRTHMRRTMARLEQRIVGHVGQPAQMACLGWRLAGQYAR